jgi:O-antigen biosynthesis protein
MPNLYILTLSWNAIDKLTKLKDTLLPSLEDVSFKWIIKDNGSQDNTYEIASKWSNNIEVIKYPNNLQNFSQGVNVCFHEADPKDDDLILLLNNDIIFNDTTSIKKMISLLKDNVGIVGAKLLYTNTDRLQHAGVVFDPTYKTPLHFRAGQQSDDNAAKNRLFQAITGAVLLMKAGDFRNVHKNISGISGMDENYHWAFDDVDLCLAVHLNMNKQVVYCGDTNIFHEESASLKKNPVNKLFLMQNIQYLFQKWKGRYKIDRPIYEKDPNHNLYLNETL